MTEERFKKVFDRFHPNLVAYAGKIIDDFEVAQDIVADSFIYWYNSPVEATVKTLFLKTKQLCWDYKKRKGMLEKHHDYIESVSEDHYFEAWEIKAELIYVLSIVGNLPPDRKRVFSLKINGYSNRQIADLLKISIDTVRVQISRARRFIKQQYLTTSLQ